MQINVVWQQAITTCVGLGVIFIVKENFLMSIDNTKKKLIQIGACKMHGKGKALICT